MLVGFCPDDDLIAREAWERQMEEQAAQEQRVRDAKAQSAEAYAEIERGDIRAIQRRLLRANIGATIPAQPMITHHRRESA